MTNKEKTDVPPEGGKDTFTRERLQEIAHLIDEELPDKWGFFLMTFPFGDAEGRYNYIANGSREDVIKVMKNFIAKSTKENFGTHSDERL